jgi:ankyrin repeat protein
VETHEEPRSLSPWTDELILADGVLLRAMPNLDTPGGLAPKLTLPHGDPVAVELTSFIHGGDLDVLRRLLAERPELASVRMIGRKGLEGGWRTPLHAATDWPGYFPAAPAAVALLLETGADPNDDTGGGRPETPLHWAASTDDLDVAVVLIDTGADLETPGGSIGTPLDNAIGYNCWHVARLLVARGAKLDRLWHAAALGSLERIEQLLAARPTPPGEVSQAFWHACAGGQRRAAEYLLARGAELNWVPDYAQGTALDAAGSRTTRRENVVGWLRERGATSAETGD